MLAESITREDYEKLLISFEERPAVRLLYDRGYLEIAVTPPNTSTPTASSAL